MQTNKQVSMVFYLSYIEYLKLPQNKAGNVSEKCIYLFITYTVYGHSYG